MKLSIREKPSRLAGADEDKPDLDFATYYHTVSNVSEALGYAQKALVSNPNSIPAYILVGDIKEAQGDLRGALTAYRKAKHEFCQQYPNSSEPPLYLIYKTSSLMNKLEGKP